ncbi:cyclic AMP-responsive element-binding protein 3-like protein 3-A [Pholidichthys leucotaenia]
MEYYSDQGCDGTELLDWLFDQNNGILHQEETGQYQSHPTWPIQTLSQVFQPPGQSDSDFLNALLNGKNSVSTSPLWSPSPSDSGISEDPTSDHMDSPRHPESPREDTRFFSTEPPAKAVLEASVSTDFNGWSLGFPMGKTRITQYPTDVHRSQLSPGFSPSVKDLLLSGPQESTSQPSPKSVQELILNEDEKKLLAKEGVTLPNQLPLTKHEERILKKVRRKIRNKQSAQESRKKKKEYIDGLESRMAACNTHNQELQRKVSQLEKHNMSLIEQLQRLRALVMNTSNKSAQTGTCVLVLLLSFSLILFPSLKPFSDTKVSQGDFTPVRIQSRSLQNLQASRVLYVADSPFSTVDDSDSLHHHFTEDQELEDISTLKGKMEVEDKQFSLESVSFNRSQEDGVDHIYADPITGHIAVTLNPQNSSRFRPHADDM